MSTHVALDVAVLLVSVPVWTRENERFEYPDRLPAPFANHMLCQRYADRLMGHADAV